MKVINVYPNGNFRVLDGEVEYDVRQCTHSKPVKVNDEIKFTEMSFKTHKFVKDGREQSKVIILSFNFEIV